MSIPNLPAKASYIELDWEGVWDDPLRPKTVVGPICGLKMRPKYAEYEASEKAGLGFVAMSLHHPEKTR